MKIRVTARPGAKTASVEEAETGEKANLFSPQVRRGARHVIVRVRDPAKEGKANEAVQKALARHFNIAVSHVRLVSGFSSREKIFEVPSPE